jgi:hypothetical protein
VLRSAPPAKPASPLKTSPRRTGFSKTWCAGFAAPLKGWDRHQHHDRVDDMGVTDMFQGNQLLAVALESLEELRRINRSIWDLKRSINELGAQLGEISSGIGAVDRSLGELGIGHDISRMANEIESIARVVDRHG